MVVIPRYTFNTAGSTRAQRAAQAGRRRPGAASGATTGVTGGAAELIDYTDVISPVPLMIAVITLATFLILVVILRALLLAAIAVALNLVTVAVAFGVLTLLFDVPEGWPLGGHTYVDAIGAAGIFGIIFGLSIDYAVFLLMRMREHYENNASNEEAIVFGLEKTARVITGAAAIMMAVFVAFAGADIATVSQLGTGLTVAVAARRHRRADRPAAGADAAARRPGLVAAAAAGENPARNRSSWLAGGLRDECRTWELVYF